MIRPGRSDEARAICDIINAAAVAYAGVIPADCWHEPYMPLVELLGEIAAGVEFHAVEEGGRLLAVMGLQHVEDVALIRHAYTDPARQRQGHGAALLEHLRIRTRQPLLVGTWKAATWAIRFYEKHEFAVVGPEEKERLLRRYWTIPDRQIDESVVLADAAWLASPRRSTA